MVSRLQMRPPARSVSVATGLERLQAAAAAASASDVRPKRPRQRHRNKSHFLSVLLLFALVVAATVFSDVRRRPLAVRLHLLGRARPRPTLVALISDLDRDSCRDAAYQPTTCATAAVWVSYYKRMVVPPLSAASSPDAAPAQVRFVDQTRLEVRDQPGARGMELSELIVHAGHVLAPDDRGVLYEIMSPRGAMPSNFAALGAQPASAVPPATLRRALLADGDGSDPKRPFKAEWGVVKDGTLIIGGHGRPVTKGGTTVQSEGPLWVKLVADDLTVTHANWTHVYAALDDAAGVRFPGYLMHEAVLWSPLRREWVFLPRRRSEMPFGEVANARRGWNGMLVADEHMSDIRQRYIHGLHEAERFRGFSAAAWLPGSGDEIIVALRTVEIDAGTHGRKDRFTSTYMCAFSIAGELVMKEQRVGGKKYEGLVFL